jgi:hypothetical protein
MRADRGRTAPGRRLALAQGRTYVRAMTSWPRGHFDREQRAEAQREQPPPSLDRLVEVVREVAGDQAAGQYKALNEPPADAERTER